MLSLMFVIMCCLFQLKRICARFFYLSFMSVDI